MIATLILVLVVVAVIGARTLLTAKRLDRLHVRTDAAWAALDAALARRAVLARVLAGCDDQALRAIARRAEFAGRADRESTENDLTRALTARLFRIPPTDAPTAPEPPEGAGKRSWPDSGAHACHLAGDLPPSGCAELEIELNEAAQRVVLARRVYNDAVRDTLRLRGRLVVRWLRLAGTAARPAYFEILEPVDIEARIDVPTVRQPVAAERPNDLRPGKWPGREGADWPTSPGHDGRNLAG